MHSAAGAEALIQTCDLAREYRVGSSTIRALDGLDLVVLEDDRRFFPDYQAVLLVREDFIERFPRTWQALGSALEGQIDEERMGHLNALADLDGRSFPHVVAEFFHLDWTSRARRKIGVPCLHLLEHESIEEQSAGGGEGVSGL